MSAVVLTLGTTAPAGAQNVPRTEVSGGYQLLEFNAADETLEKGWYADVAGEGPGNDAVGWLPPALASVDCN